MNEQTYQSTPPFELNMPLVGTTEQYVWKVQPNQAAVSIPPETVLKMDALAKQAGAVKYDGDKPPMHLLSNEALVQIAKVMQFGAQKYAAHNWRKGFDWSRSLAAALRHINAFNDGEDTDPESGLSHMAHAACNLMFLIEFEKTHKHLDDRYKAGSNV
jgi:Domain of unknown function (DUF5664)